MFLTRQRFVQLSRSKGVSTRSTKGFKEIQREAKISKRIWWLQGKVQREARSRKQLQGTWAKSNICLVIGAVCWEAQDSNYQDQDMKCVQFVEYGMNLANLSRGKPTATLLRKARIFYKGNYKPSKVTMGICLIIAIGNLAAKPVAQHECSFM